MEVSEKMRGKFTPGIWGLIVVLVLTGGVFFLGWKLSESRQIGEKMVVNTGDNKGQEARVQEQTTPTVGVDRLSAEGLKLMAKNLGIETKKYDQCLAEGRYRTKVQDGILYAQNLGVTGTPTYFINGIMVVGALPQEQFEKIIEAEIKDGSGDKVVGVGSGEKLVRKKITTGVGYIEGTEKAKVKMVVFSSFACSYCARGAQTEKLLLTKYPNDLSLEFRQYSTQSVSEALECVGEQGKFWQAHDY